MVAGRPRATRARWRRVWRAPCPNDRSIRASGARIEDRVQAKLAAQRAAASDRPPARRRDPAGWGVAVLLLGLYLTRNPERMAPSPTSRTFGFGAPPQIRAAARVL